MSLVGVDVATHRRMVLVTGRVASGEPVRVLSLDLPTLVRGALRARQVALEVSRRTGAREVLVLVAFVPACSAGIIREALVDGKLCSADSGYAPVHVLESIGALCLSSVKWSQVLRNTGYFGARQPWNQVEVRVLVRAGDLQCGQRVSPAPRG